MNPYVRKYPHTAAVRGTDGGNQFLNLLSRGKNFKNLSKVKIVMGF